MSRKSNYLIISETKDREVYNLLLNCRHSTLEQLKEFTSQNRINSYLKEKLIERVDSQNNTVYRLTNKGYKVFDRIIGSDNLRYHSQSISHDIALSQKYIDTLREFPNRLWLNEEDLKSYKRELINEYRENRDYERLEKLERSSVPDCVIHSEISICFDIITDNYSNADIIAKEEFAECIDLKCEFEKI